MANGPFSGVTTWQGVNVLLSNGTIDPSTAALIIGDMQAHGTGGLNNSGSGWNSSSALPSGMPLPSGNENSPNTTASTATQATAAGGWLSGITGKLGDWALSGITGKRGDWALIAFGAIMILGALMISQKETVIQVAKAGME